MNDIDKRSICHHGKYCAKKTCDDCTPALPPRSKKCLHWLTNPGVCAYDGGPCCDGDFGKLCDCFVDRETRPSKNHVFDLAHGEWTLKKEHVDMTELNMKEDIRGCCYCIMNLLGNLNSVGKENKSAKDWLKKTCDKYGFTEFVK